MPGLDALIATELSFEIKKKLDKETLRKLERKLFTKHGISIKQSIENFEKFDNVLKEFLGSSRHNFESQIIKKVFVAKKTEDKNNILIIKSPKLVNFLITCCGDPEILKILTIPFKQPLTISEILGVTKIPRSSGYRKISQLIRKGLLIKRSTALSKSKRVEKFTKLFIVLAIKIKEGRNEVLCKIPKNIYTESSVIKLQSTFN